MDIVLGCLFLATLCGCVERTLRINTAPEGATVFLNDEEIGDSPVTVDFKWYGDYRVRILKEGYQTLLTHRELKAPWYDHFPFDFFAQISPQRIVDHTDWTFELQPLTPLTRAALIQKAEALRQELSDTNSPTPLP